MSDSAGWVPPPGYGPPPTPPGYGPPPTAPGWGQPQPPPGYGPPPSYPGYGPPQPPPGWGQQWGAPPDVKPGVVPLRPLTIGEILDGGFATVRKHAKPIFGVAAVLGGVVQLSRVVVGLAFHDVGGALSGVPYTTTGSGQDFELHLDSAGITATVVQYVLSAILAALLIGFVTAVVAQAVLGRPVDTRDLVRRVAARWWKLLMVSLVAGILPFLPLALFILFALPGSARALGVLGILGLPVAFYIWGKITVAVPALVLERLGVAGSIARSWRLVRGSFWRTWWLRFLTTLIVGIAGTVIGLPFRLLAALFGGGLSSFAAGGGSHIGAGVITTIGSAFVWMLTEPLLASVVTLIYIDRRMRAEALDLQLIRAAQLQQQQQQQRPQWQAQW
jgi:hypothetical protein